MLHIHDFYIYWIISQLIPCMHQPKEIITNFIVIHQISDCMCDSRNRASCDSIFIRLMKSYNCEFHLLPLAY